MKNNLVVTLAILGLMVSAGCSRKSNESIAPLEPAQENQSTQNMRIGTLENPELNLISISDDLPAGTQITSYGYAKEDGYIYLTAASVTSEECSSSDFQSHIAVDTVLLKSEDVTFPIVLKVSAGEIFSIKYFVDSNPCEQISKSFFASWSATDPTAKPVVDVPVEKTWTKLAECIDQDSKPNNHADVVLWHSSESEFLVLMTYSKITGKKLMEYKVEKKASNPDLSNSLAIYKSKSIRFSYNTKKMLFDGHPGSMRTTYGGIRMLICKELEKSE